MKYDDTLYFEVMKVEPIGDGSWRILWRDGPNAIFQDAIIWASDGEAALRHMIGTEYYLWQRRKAKRT